VNQTAFSMALSMLLQMPEFVELILTTVILNFNQWGQLQSEVGLALPLLILS
jgi:hypothetical protein